MANTFWEGVSTEANGFGFKGFMKQIVLGSVSPSTYVSDKSYDSPCNIGHYSKNMLTSLLKEMWKW